MPVERPVPGPGRCCLARHVFVAAVAVVEQAEGAGGRVCFYAWHLGGRRALHFVEGAESWDWAESRTGPECVVRARFLNRPGNPWRAALALALALAMAGQELM